MKSKLDLRNMGIPEIQNYIKSLKSEINFLENCIQDEESEKEDLEDKLEEFIPSIIYVKPNFIFITKINALNFIKYYEIDEKKIEKEIEKLREEIENCEYNIDTWEEEIESYKEIINNYENNLENIPRLESFIK